MKEIYRGEYKRAENGLYFIDDSKFCLQDMTEVQLSAYFGSILGAAVERMRMVKTTGSLFITMSMDDKTWREVTHD